MNASILRAARLLGLRWAFRLLFGLPRPVRRLLAGPLVRRDGQVLDLDLQLLGRVSALLSSADGGTLDQSVLAEQRRQADFAAEVAAPPGPDDIITHDLTLDGPAGPLSARLYVPPSAPALSGLLVYFHGGGFVSGSIETADPMSRYLSTAAECIVVNVGFRVAPEDPFPASVDDGFAALQWAAAEASSFGGDASRLAIGGDASGGTFAAVCAQLARRSGPPLRFQLLLSAATDLANRHPSRDEFADDPLIPSEMVDMILDAYAPAEVDRTDPKCSPLLADDLSGLPPAYILASEYDFLRDEEQAYADALRDAGVDVTYHCWQGTVHNFFSMHDHLDIAREAMAEAAGTLRAALNT